MSQPKQLLAQLQQVETLSTITTAFEGIASTRIVEIKDSVINSRQFFDELWHIYSLLRVKDDQAAADKQAPKKSTQKPSLVIGITSESRFSGLIDQAIIKRLAHEVDPHKADIILFGRNGVRLLQDYNLTPKLVIPLPDSSEKIDITPVANLIPQYDQKLVYYQSFVNLSTQRVAVIELQDLVQTMSETPTKQTDQNLIYLEHYIVEPDQATVIEYLQSIMVGIGLNQVIWESRLAQYASRFTAMAHANQKAKELKEDLRLDYLRARRQMRDERLKETVLARKLR